MYFGMLRRRTSGAGSPRSADHFVVLNIGNPFVIVTPCNDFARDYEVRPGSGKKDTRSKWYFKCKAAEPSMYIEAIAAQ
jgi:hypothetical protein